MSIRWYAFFLSLDLKMNWNWLFVKNLTKFLKLVLIVFELSCFVLMHTVNLEMSRDCHKLYIRGWLLKSGFNSSCVNV